MNDFPETLKIMNKYSGAYCQNCRIKDQQLESLRHEMVKLTKEKEKHKKWLKEK